MKTLLLVLASVLTASTLRAAELQKTTGTQEEHTTRNGLALHKLETHPELSALHATRSRIEVERGTLLPNSGLTTSYLKWTSSDAAAIGQDVSITPGGEHVFIGWNLNNVRVSFHDEFLSVPLWEHYSNPSAYRNFVALSANALRVPNGSYQNLYLFNKDNGSVLFNFIPEGSRIAGPVAIARDGSLLLCVAVSPLAGGTHRLYAFTPTSTTPLWTYDLSDAQGSGIYGISLSNDNSTVAVNTKFHGWTLNAATGTLKTDLAIANTESPIALSADASVMAVAELSGFIKAFSWNEAISRYDLIWQYKVPAGAFTNWASAVDVSADGLTIMAGSLIFLSGGYDGTIYIFDTFGEGLPNWVYTGVGDEVSGVALSDDGSIGVAITWGDLANALPDILVFERDSNVPVYALSTPGSMFSVAISADGKSIVAGGKAVHARQFGNGGNVYNIGVDLGGGFIAGNVSLSGSPNNAGATVQVVGTTRKAVTASDGSYIINNVPAGTHSVRASMLGYVSTTISGVAVATGDTTTNINATLAQTGAPPTNLVASHSLDSRINLAWTNPTRTAQRIAERALAADEHPIQSQEGPSGTLRTIAAASGGSQSVHYSPSPGRLFGGVVEPDSVKVYRAIRSGGPYYHKWTLPGSQSSYSDTTALPLQEYYYVVTAVYGAGESVYSNEALGTVDSSFLQFSIAAPQLAVTPAIDGVLSAGEWTDALRLDVSDVFGNGGGVRLPRGSVFMYFKYDSVAKRLYIAGEDLLNTDGLTNGEGFGLYFDDNFDRQFGPVNGNPLLREGNYWAYYFSSGPTVRFREIYNTGGVNPVVDTVFDAQTAISAGSGHVVGEVSIPLSFFDKNHLQVYGPGKKVGAGLFMIGRDGVGNAVFHGWWPQTMTSVFSPDGFGDIQIPVALLAPPKAPTNVAVNRGGNGLQVTWTDPTEGLNGDPLTIPITLEVYTNGALETELPTGVQSFLDTNVVDQGWYEYRIRGYVDIPGPQKPSTIYHGPFSPTVGAFAGSDPQLTEVIYDDGIPEVFYVVDFSYNGNRFGTRFTPIEHPARVYRVKVMTNNGFSPILVSIHADSSGFPGEMLTSQYTGESFQTSGIDSFIVTIPGSDPPEIESGDFHVVLSYLPTSPGAPGIGADFTAPTYGRSAYFTWSSGWLSLPADLIVRAFITGQPLDVTEDGDVPTEFALHQNYPNPFNPSTRISYSVQASPTGQAVFTSLKVYDVLGREVATLVNEVQTPGKYTATWDASGQASGVYLCKLMAGPSAATRKLILLR